MEPREVIGIEALLLEQCNRERVTECERDRRARSRRKVVRTSFLLDPAVERDIAVSRQGRLRIAGQRNSAYPEALQMVEQTDDLDRFSALRDENRDVGFIDDAEVAMHAVGRMK